MTLAGLSKNIQRRLLTFYDATFDGEYFRRNEINEILGEKLVLMVKMETYFDLVRKCRFFHLLHDELIASIVEYMREVEHNEGEVLEFNQTQVSRVSNLIWKFSHFFVHFFPHDRNFTLL